MSTPEEPPSAEPPPGMTWNKGSFGGGAGEAPSDLEVDLERLRQEFGARCTAINVARTLVPDGHSKSAQAVVNDAEIIFAFLFPSRE